MKFYFIGCLVALCLNSCSTKELQVSMSGDVPYADSSFDFSMYTYVKSDTVFFGSSRIFFRDFTYIGAHGDTLRSKVWFPGGQHTDSSKFLLLIPGFHDQPLELYPLAIEATKRGLITVILCPRGIDLNKTIADDYGVQSVQDAENAITTFEKNISHRPTKVAVFGCSLGSITALNLGTIDERITGLVLESIMINVVSTSKLLLNSSEEDQLQKLLQKEGKHSSDYNADSLIQKLSIRKKVLAIWGENDKLISPEERKHIRSIIEMRIPTAEFEQVPGVGHVLRYGLPLSQHDARNLNEKIINFLRSSILK